MTSLLNDIATTRKVLIVGDRSVDHSGVMYESALSHRGVESVWMSMADLLAQVCDRHGVTLLETVQRNPYAVDIVPEQFQFAPDAPIRGAYSHAIVVSNDAEPYLATLCRVLDSIGLQQLNNDHAVAASQDKWATHVKLRDAGLPVPHAVLIHNISEARFAARALQLPVVIKELKGAQGTGVRMARSIDELDAAVAELEVERQPLMIEHYIECGASDRRLIVVDGRYVNAMSRHAADGEFRANLSQGGSSARFDPSPFEIKLAERAAEVLGLRLAGVDMSVVTEALPGREYLEVGQPFFMEVNNTPAMDGPYNASGINGAENVVAILLGE